MAAVAGRGPYRLALYESGDAGVDAPDAAVGPGVPAEVLADDPALADRCRERAPAGAGDPGESADALAAFLENEEKIAAIQERARREAERRAAEWGIDVDGGGGDAGAGGSTDPDSGPHVPPGDGAGDGPLGDPPPDER
ncbi:MAG: hypothetical protein ABEJ42_06635 [Halobacteriaceae archaeon]